MKHLFTAYLVLNLILESIAAVTLIGAGLGLFLYARRSAWCMDRL